MTSTSNNTENYWAIVDMGSNGIRCSITDLSPDTARILPALYSDRIPISLYDAQYQDGEKRPIPDAVIDSVIAALSHFQRTTLDYGVPASQCRIIATEATRVAENSSQFRAAIKNATGWDVTMLAKEDEGRTGAYGVTSSFYDIQGLMMDLGGGSTQITWIEAKHGEMKMSEAGSVSMPYGAAALTRRLAEADQQGGDTHAKLRDEIVANLKDAIRTIDIPQKMLEEIHSPTGLNLYLCGGGFRGWGYVLMNQHHISPYPIPIINGFKVAANQFLNTQLVTLTASEDGDIFRVSERRASQIPAVARLITCLIEALPAVKNVYFAQGGVREGFLFSQLPAVSRSEHPLVTATNKFASPSADGITAALLASAPSDVHLVREKEWVHRHLVRALGQSMFIHNTMSKDICAASALRSTTTGALAAVNGADHEERALLGLMLCERWGGAGALSPADFIFQRNLLALCSDDSGWWAMFFGCIAAIFAGIYPAGLISGRSLVTIRSSWKDIYAHLKDNNSKAKEGHNTTDKKHKVGKKEKNKHHDERIDAANIVTVHISVEKNILASDNFAKAVRRLEKLGKKKNWPVESEGYKVETEVTALE